MKGFTFFENFFRSISDEKNGLTPAQEGEVYRAILYYVFRGEELPLEGAGRMAFNLIKPSLDISRVRSAARSSANKEETNAEEERTSGESTENQNGIKPESNEHQTEMKSENLTFLEEIETERSKRKKEINKKTSTAGAGAREDEDGDGGKVYVSHADIMDRFGVTGLYREIVEEYLRCCYLHHYLVPNNVLEDILSRLDRCHGNDTEAKILSIRKAINGGYYDIEELRDASELWR